MTQNTKLMPENEALITNVTKQLQKDIETLTAWLITNPKDYIIVSKDRMHVVQRDGDTAKIGHYPQLPTIFYAGNVAYRIAGNFRAYKGDGKQIELEAVRVVEFATAAIKDLTARIEDLKQLL